MSRLHIEHVTEIDYEGGATASFNEIRMTPAVTPNQRVWNTKLEVTPSDWRLPYIDYWGTAVTVVNVERAHPELLIEARSDVEVLPVDYVPGTLTFAELAAPEVEDRFGELLANRARTAPPDELVELAHETARDASPQDAALALCGIIADRVHYQPGSTSVFDDAEAAWDRKVGVCQDFVHLTVGALRALGIPARYVSGYLNPRPDAGVGAPAAAQSHAWVEWWAGSWYGYDPTNARVPGSDHVLVGRGRDYDDVAPFRGVYAGGHSHQRITVEITRLE